MIALDTNALVRMLVEDDKDQARVVQEVVLLAETNSFEIIILSEVLIEAVWVLESVYKCTRNEIYRFLEALISSSTFIFPDSSVIRRAVHQYKTRGDFADLLIVGQAMKQRAKKFLSFDKTLQKTFPDYVVDKFTKEDL